MAEQAKSGARHAIWKYLGAMMMERKVGGMAASFTRVLAISLFIPCLVIWILKAVQGDVVDGVMVGGVPDDMLHTLWVLIGIKGAKDVAKGVKGQ